MEYNEALHELKEMTIITCDADVIKVSSERIKDYVPSLIEPIEDALKVLDIIKAKDVRMSYVIMCKDYATYIWQCNSDEIDNEWRLTKEEFDLFIKVFCGLRR